MKTSIQDVKTKLYAGRYHVAAILPIYVFLSWFLESWFAGGALALAVVYLVDRQHSRYSRALENRIQATDGPTWDVEVNQVKVGTITDALYAEIRFQEFHDVRNYSAQVTNLFGVVFRFLNACLVAIPVGVLWFAVALAVFSPESITALQAASAAEIGQAISNGARMLPIVMLFSLNVNWLLGLSNFGFVNRFEEAVSISVRKRCGVAAKGSTVLFRWTQDGLVFTDEMASMRRLRKA